MESLDKQNIVRFTLDDGEELEFEVYDQVDYNRHKYLLVIEAGQDDEEDAEGIILKQMEEVDGDIVYEMIDDEQEYLMVLELFRENSDDYDLDYEK